MPIRPLSERLRARRTELGLTLAQVAERAGLSIPYVSNLERRESNPSLDALSAIAEALETTVSALTDQSDQGTQKDGATSRALATAPASLTRFTRSQTFIQATSRLADQQAVSEDEMRERLIHAMATAPRRSKGEPTDEDWRRLLDVFRLILSETD